MGGRERELGGERERNVEKDDQRMEEGVERREMDYGREERKKSK